MNLDPRYSGSPIGGAQPSVTYMDNRKPVYELAIVGMLLTQFLLFSVLAWKFLSPSTATAQRDQDRIVELEGKLNSLNAAQDQTTRERAYNEVLSTLVASQTGDANLVDEFSKAKIESQHLAANLDGQMALAEKLELEKQQALIELQFKTNDSEKLQSQLVRSRDQLEKAQKEIETLQEGEADAEDAEMGIVGLHWSWLAIGGLVTTLLGSALGYALGRKEDRYDGEFESDRRDSPRSQTAQPTKEPVQEHRRDEHQQSPGLDFDPPPEPTIETQPVAETSKVSLKIDGGADN